MCATIATVGGLIPGASAAPIQSLRVAVTPAVVIYDIRIASPAGARGCIATVQATITPEGPGDSWGQSNRLRVNTCHTRGRAGGWVKGDLRRSRLAPGRHRLCVVATQPLRRGGVSRHQRCARVVIPGRPARR